MFGTSHSWHHLSYSVAELQLNDNNMAVAEVDGKKITVAFYNDKLFAFAYKCPHASGIMADGFVDSMGYAVCPLHRFRFNLKTGRDSNNDGYFLKIYPVEQREDGWYISI